MDLKEQKYVCTLAECKSLTRASERLYISQPALSLYINNVEKILGARLFERNGRKFELTWLGKQYVEKASQMLELERQFEAVRRQAERENAINKLFVSEMHRQRNSAHLCAAALRQIDGRVDKNADGFHRVSSCSAAHSRSRLPQINSSAAYILLRCSSVRPMLAASSIEAMRACRAAKISRPRSVRYRGLR